MVKSVSAAREQVSTPCRKLLQTKPNLKPHHAKKKSSLTKILLDYLTSDSFMYGPLLCPPPKKCSPGLEESAHNGLPQRASPLSHNEGISNVSSLETPSTPNSALRRVSTLTRRLLGRAAANDGKHGHEVAPSPTERRQYREAMELRPPAEKDPSGDGNLTDQGDEIDNEDNESSKSFTESQTELDVTPLHKEGAMEIARRLVKKVGGRFSKELGIFVDIRDSEAERWFLVTTFLGNSSDFELARPMYKKLQTMGITKIQDVLGIDQRELEEAFEQVMRNQRIASRLQKIALGLHAEHGGGACSLKRVADYGELKKDLEKLPGYSRNSARIFLREMRGIWPGASPEYELRTRTAAKHLHLLASTKDGTEATSSLIELAQDAGVDERDLEVALVKLSLQHSRQYRNCPGGRECEFARITLSDLEHLIVNL